MHWGKLRAAFSKEELCGRARAAQTQAVGLGSGSNENGSISNQLESSIRSNEANPPKSI
jgi:hypothetical protein